MRFLIGIQKLSIHFKISLKKKINKEDDLGCPRELKAKINKFIIYDEIDTYRICNCYTRGRYCLIRTLLSYDSRINGVYRRECIDLVHISMNADRRVYVVC